VEMVHTETPDLVLTPGSEPSPRLVRSAPATEPRR
jgi:hypothetical protein